MLFHFSVSGLIGYVFSVVICIGIWRVYLGCKNNTLISGGFSMINVILTIEMVLWMLAAAVIAIVGFAVLAAGEIVPGFLILAVGFLLGFYWWSLRKVSHCAYHAANGTGENLHSSIWPIVILVIISTWRILSFISKISLQLAANQAAYGITQYSNGLSSDIANYLEAYGLAYQYSYGEASSLLRTFTEPILDWIQTNLGLQESVFGMLFALLIPPSASVILIKLRENSEK